MTDDAKMILEEIQKLKADVKDIQLTLENETNRNIRLIAEGHLDLSRKLDEALKADSEKEMLMIRVNCLENEVRKLKERIEEIAWINLAIKAALLLMQAGFFISRRETPVSTREPPVSNMEMPVFSRLTLVSTRETPVSGRETSKTAKKDEKEETKRRNEERRKSRKEKSQKKRVKVRKKKRIKEEVRRKK